MHSYVDKMYCQDNYIHNKGSLFHSAQRLPRVVSELSYQLQTDKHLGGITQSKDELDLSKHGAVINNSLDGSADVQRPPELEVNNVAVGSDDEDYLRQALARDGVAAEFGERSGLNEKSLSKTSTRPTLGARSTTTSSLQGDAQQAFHKPPNDFINKLKLNWQQILWSTSIVSPSFSY